MIRNHLVKFIAPAVCSLSITYGVIPKTPILEANNSLIKKIIPFNEHFYKGMHPINNYGWYLTQKWNTDLKHVERFGQWYEIKGYFSHPDLGFAIFKVDLGIDAKKDQFPKLKYLAEPEDLQSNANWATSLAFVPDPLSHEGRISASREGYTKPLQVISKIENQENGYFTLGLRGSLETFNQEMWPKIRWKVIRFCSYNTAHVIKLLESPQYKTDYIIKNRANLIQNKINYLAELYESHKKEYIDRYKRVFPDISVNKKIMDQFTKLDFNQRIGQQAKLLREQGESKQQEIDDLLKDEKSKLWETHKKDLEAKKTLYLNQFNINNTSPEDYSRNTPSSKQGFYTQVAVNFHSDFFGVADKEDHGGLILVESKDLNLLDSKYGYYSRIAGITCVREGDDLVEGEQSRAIDLTTREVHDWISQKIDSYYNPQDPMDKGKRPTNDPGPSDQNKRPRIKEEAPEEDTARRDSDSKVLIKEEIKEELKKEI